MNNKQQQIEWTKSFKSGFYTYEVKVLEGKYMIEGIVIHLTEIVMDEPTTLTLSKADARKIIELLQEAVK